MACLMFCNCLLGRRGLLLTGCLSVLTCITILASSLYCILGEESWSPVRSWLDSVLEAKNWSREEWRWVATTLQWLDTNHTYILAGIVTTTAFQLMAAILLLIAALTTTCSSHTFIINHQQTLRLMLLPWLCTDLINTTAILILFIIWTFISYIIDLYMAIVFPVLGGLLLGVWLVMYRNVYNIYRDRGGKDTTACNNVKTHN